MSQAGNGVFCFATATATAGFAIGYPACRRILRVEPVLVLASIISSAELILGWGLKY